MSSINSRNDLLQYSEKVWMTKPKPFSANGMTQGITVYMRSDDETLVAISYFTLDPNGTYYLKNEPLGKMDDPAFRGYIDKLTGADRSAPKEKKAISYEIDDALFDRVCESYESTSSIKRTAKDIGISEQKARKILITRGKYTCETYQRILQMTEDGKDLSQIAEELNITRGQLLSYLPYSK